jgi:hypothetical protein
MDLTRFPMGPRPLMIERPRSLNVPLTPRGWRRDVVEKHWACDDWVDERERFRNARRHDALGVREALDMANIR